jgi:two-component system, LytTR family, sensor histidine kinase AlgZ
LRYSLERAEQPHVALRDELDAVRDYLEIELVRFGSRLRASVEVDEHVDLGSRVPPMVLQPLVENAVLHGIGRSVAGGAVRVTVAGLDHGRIDLAVDDDGPTAGAAPHVGTRTSLANLEERLRIVYGDRATLVVGPRPAGGFRARVLLPGRPG